MTYEDCMGQLYAPEMLLNASQRIAHVSLDLHRAGHMAASEANSLAVRLGNEARALLAAEHAAAQELLKPEPQITEQLPLFD